MINYEILSTTQRGVLPAVALFNRQMQTEPATYQLSVEYFEQFLDILNEFVDINTQFNDTSSEDWLNYYNALAKLAHDNELIIYEHQFGLYILQEGIKYDPMALYLFEKSLIPLKIEGPEAISARKFGLKYAGAQYNNKPNIIAVLPEKKPSIPRWRRKELYARQDKRMYKRIRQREGRQEGEILFQSPPLYG